MGMARPVWTGSISFGLVNVPVKAYTAVRDHDVHFHRLKKGTTQRVRNKMVAEDSGRAVDDEDVVMGFEVSKGHYVTFSPEELDELRPASTRSVDVTDFVELADIDPIYYERTYWLAPDGEAGKRAYRLLHAVMEDEGRVGIGAVVMRNKQYLAAIRPLEGILAMSTMRFADEIVPRKELELPASRSKPDAKAMHMAKQLVEGLSSPWKPEQYHDTYTEELRARIEAKSNGQSIVDEPEQEPAAVVDLMAALEASLREKRSGRKPVKRPSRSRSHGRRKSA
jgi:DNA end-binding protein Ku